jgi:hypothetical protein
MPWRRVPGRGSLTAGERSSTAWACRCRGLDICARLRAASVPQQRRFPRAFPPPSVIGLTLSSQWHRGLDTWGTARRRGSLATFQGGGHSGLAALVRGSLACGKRRPRGVAGALAAPRPAIAKQGTASSRCDAFPRGFAARLTAVIRSTRPGSESIARASPGVGRRHGAKRRGLLEGFCEGSGGRGRSGRRDRRD